MSDAKPFFDSNVLLYLLSANSKKANRTEELLGQPGLISVQVLNEFTSVAIRKIGLSFSELREILTVVRTACEVQPLTVQQHELGLDIAERYKFSIYDSMIVASALIADCKTLFSEDLQHRQVIDKQLTIINPFISS